MPVVHTPVYDTFWRFAAERQAIFHRRASGQGSWTSRGPWTNDPILQEYKFTNAYRAADRVSQYLIKEVIHLGDGPFTRHLDHWIPEEIFFRTILFKLFNRISTWELLKKHTLGEVIMWGDWKKRGGFGRALAILDAAVARKEAILGAAYIMPSGSGTYGYGTKRGDYLALLSHMMDEDVPRRIYGAKTMEEGFNILKSFPIMGDFLAYQFITDLNYSPVYNFSEMEFVVAGPGAQDGIDKCFSNKGGLKYADIIRMVTAMQGGEFRARGLDFQDLWGRPLQLIDVQNLFCEVSKYARVAHPDVQGKTGRTQIKARFKPNREPIQYWFPTKWGINENIGGLVR